MVVGPLARASGGEYRFDQPVSPLAVVDKIASGDVYTQRLTFPEGLTIAEMAKVFESRGFGPARAFIKAAGDGALVKDLDREGEGSRRLSVSRNLLAAAPRRRVARWSR